MSRFLCVAALLLGGFLVTASEVDAAPRRAKRRVVRRAAVVRVVRAPRFRTVIVGRDVFGAPILARVRVR